MKRLHKLVSLLAIAALAFVTWQMVSTQTTANQVKASNTNSVAATLVDATSTAASVMIQDNYFSPTTTTVSLGTTVTWTNQGTVAHTVTADNGSFNSGDISPGGTFSYTFNTAGSFNYYCMHHGGPGLTGMSGTIVVTNSTTSSSTSTPPSAPTNLTAGSSTPSSIYLSWNAATTTGSSTISGYNVVRDGTTFASTTQTNYTDTGLTSATTYNYDVLAFDNLGNISPASNLAVGTTAAATTTSTSTTSTTTPPAAPTNLTVSSTSPTSITLSWTAPSSSSSTIIGYNVIRNGMTLASTTQATYTDMGLSNSTTYSYNVSAFDGSGNNSNWSNTVYGTTGSGSSSGGTGTSTPPSFNFNGTIGWLVLPANLYNTWQNASSTSSSTPFTYVNGYPTLNGNYLDCSGNVDNDMAHHSTNTNDTDPGHHIGQNCPGGMPSVSGNQSGGNLPQNFMTNWLSFPNSNQQWVVIPLNSQNLQWLANHVSGGIPNY